MLICIDYDGTYTEDPLLWSMFIVQAKNKNHKVICCTMRYEKSEGDEVKMYLEGLVDKIYFTEREAKKKYLSNLGIFPKIWIDDMPELLFYDTKPTEEL